MLNIYNVPPNGDGPAILWLEFPGESLSDSYASDYGVCLASNPCPSREDRGGGIIYGVGNEAVRRARSAREAVQIIGAMVERYGFGASGCSYLIADRNEGWICAVVRGGRWVARRVPDDGIATIAGCYTIGEINLKDTVNYLGSKDIIKYARKRGWYRPRRDGAFSFRLAYANPASLGDSLSLESLNHAGKFFFGKTVSSRDVSFSARPPHKFHRRDLSKLLTEPSIRNGNTSLTTVFTINPAFPPDQGTVVWIGYPGQDAASQSHWTVSTVSPEVCHRYPTAEEALAKHFSDTGNYRERWPQHFYWHHLDPSIDMDVVPHDFTVFVPTQPRIESERDPSRPGDTFNDHFHVLEDPSKGMLYAF